MFFCLVVVQIWCSSFCDLCASSALWYVIWRKDWNHLTASDFFSFFLVVKKMRNVCTSLSRNFLLKISFQLSGIWENSDRLTAVALGEILVYSTLVLLADYVTSTTLNSKIKYIPLEVPISFSYHVWMILFTTTFIFGLLIVVVLFLNERK